MILATFEKQPAEYKDYDIDYSPWLLSMDDELDDVEVRVDPLTDPTDTTLECDNFAFTSVTGKFWVRGGTAGNRYKLTVLATTLGGRIDESELVFRIKEY